VRAGYGTSIALAGAIVLGACGGAPPRPPVAPEPPAAPPSPAGRWSWSRAGEAEPGVRVVEVERWNLVQEGTRLRGGYQRDAVFLSVDGRPFSCNQALRYALRTRYSVEGEVAGAAVRLRELGAYVDESPCETRARELASYQGTLRGDVLVLAFPGGEQTLRRDDTPVPIEQGPGDASGVWVWQNRSVDDADSDEVRIEQERWELRIDDAGVVTGGYARTVTVYREAGAIYACSGEPSYVLRERYTVRGNADRARLTLAEESAEVAPSPCDPGERHLDAAVGHLTVDALVLEWRGGRRQVLTRQNGGRNAM
jgi:hypothetical protein